MEEKNKIYFDDIATLEYDPDFYEQLLIEAEIAIADHYASKYAEEYYDE
jgi:hypothetical protein